MEIKIIQLHKKAAETFDNIEDKVNLNAGNRSIAIADGATQGYQSGFWADLLAGEFILDPVFNKEQFCNATLQHCLTRFVSHSYSTPAPANKALAILDSGKRKEGASTTFLGIRISENGACNVLACGDCLLIRHTPGIQPDFVFPFSDLASLNANTAFISSRLLAENKFDPRILYTEELYVDDRDELYLLTDALARLVFKDPSTLHQLNSLTDFEQLLDFATTNWENARLDNDDLTYVRITRVREQGMQVQKIVPYTGFSFSSPGTPKASSSFNLQQRQPQPPPPPPSPVPPQPSNLRSIEAELGDLKTYVLNTGAYSRTKNQNRFLLTAMLIGVLILIQAFILVSGGSTHSRLNNLEDWRDHASHDLTRLSDTVDSIRHRHPPDKTRDLVVTAPVIKPMTSEASNAPAMKPKIPPTHSPVPQIRPAAHKTAQPAAPPAALPVKKLELQPVENPQPKPDSPRTQSSFK